MLSNKPPVKVPCTICGVTKVINARHASTAAAAATRPCMSCSHSSHGLSRSSTYQSWRSMLKRCLKTTNHNYMNYGGRGITICESWRQRFENFLQDMGVRPDGTTLDRINVDGNYEPGNCRWADAVQQQSNRRNSLLITIDGVTKSAGTWARESGIATSLVHMRIGRGWDPRIAIATPAGATGRRHKNTGMPTRTRTRKGASP